MSLLFTLFYIVVDLDVVDVVVLVLALVLVVFVAVFSFKFIVQIGLRGVAIKN